MFNFHFVVLAANSLSSNNIMEDAVYSDDFMMNNFKVSATPFNRLGW